MTKRITIDPITRLEGHGKIEIFLNDDGSVDNVFFQVPELRGFEKFAEGRPVEEMPRITSRICGVCPEAHLAASAKAGDAVYNVTLPPTAKKLRELQYSAFVLGDHTTHFYALGGPDFVMGPDADPAARNLLGVIHKVGVEIGKDVIRARIECHEVAKILGGKPVIPVNMLPGGMSKGLTNKEDHDRILEIANHKLEFAKFTLKVVDDFVLGNKDYVDLILSDPYALNCHNMGMVDENNHVNFYDGKVRVTDTEGKEIVKYEPKDYLDVVEERVLPWSYLKFPYIKSIGWKGLVDGQDSGIYRATPLSRLNAADGMATPLAQEQYERFYDTLGGKPVNATLATHWARVIEILYAAERFLELAHDPDITGPDYRVIPTEKPTEGVGIVEAPRGTLTHHYITDEKGIVQKANLIVGTTNNNGAICMSIKKAAQGVIKAGTEVTEPMLNMIEMAFRAYDPCFACATHSLPGQMPLEVRLYDKEGNLLDSKHRE
ncbi:Ni/Fe hydrogenase subunit alpha [bacterium]|nr:Ni/Fe hydrogenase subunit alpha [bacterium]